MAYSGPGEWARLCLRVNCIQVLHHLVIMFLNLVVLYIFRDARNMAREVHDIIVEICQEYGVMTAGEAQQYVKKMEISRRYSADVWS